MTDTVLRSVGMVIGCVILVAASWSPAAAEQVPVGVVFHTDTLRRLDGHGDNWCITWAADDSQVTSMDDGEMQEAIRTRSTTAGTRCG